MKKDGTIIDPLSQEILRVLYERRTDTVTTRYLRRALADEMDVDDSEKQNERIKYRTQQKLSNLRLVDWRSQGESENGETLPNECWLSREGREFIEDNAEEILHSEESDDLEDRVAALERELAVVTDGRVDIDYVDDLHDRVSDLEKELEAVSEEANQGPDFADDLVSRSELRDEMESMKDEIISLNAESRIKMRDQIDGELEDVRVEMRKMDRSISSLKEDVRLASDQVDELKEKLDSWVSAMRPIYQWYHSDSQ